MRRGLLRARRETDGRKAKAKGYLFQQICDTEGKADLVVEEPTRSLLLRNIRILTTSYSEIAVLQMPAGVPFTIDSVGMSADSIIVAGGRLGDEGTCSDGGQRLALNRRQWPARVLAAFFAAWLREATLRRRAAVVA